MQAQSNDEVMLRARPLGGYLVFWDGELIGWVVRRGRTWRAFRAGASPSDAGHLVGSAPTRRQAVDEVWIWRRY